MREPAHISELVLFSQDPALQPMLVQEIELSRPLPAIHATTASNGEPYSFVLCVIRLHGETLGLLKLPLPRSILHPQNYLYRLWYGFQKAINEHLVADGLSPLTRMDVDGIPTPTYPACLSAREDFYSTAPFASVVVKTCDHLANLQRCLDSLTAQNYPHFEILVVDNTPTDKTTADFVQQRAATDPRIRYFCEHQAGISSSYNRGLAMARGEIVAFTDETMVVDPHWLIELVRPFKENEQLAIVTGLVLSLEFETPAQHWFEHFGGFGRGFEQRVYDLQQWPRSQPLFPYTTDQFGTGMSMACRTDLLRQEGGFPSSLAGAGPVKMGHDFDIFFRLLQAGYQIIYEPLSLAYYQHRRDYPGLQHQIYQHSIGLTAHMTKCLHEHPELLWDFLCKLPYALFHLWNAGAWRQRTQTSNYPQELSRLEHRGLLFGPFAYFFSLRETRRQRARVKVASQELVGMQQ